MLVCVHEIESSAMLILVMREMEFNVEIGRKNEIFTSNRYGARETCKSGLLFVVMSRRRVQLSVTIVACATLFVALS
jgi:hypothetical protein